MIEAILCSQNRKYKMKTITEAPFPASQMAETSKLSQSKIISNKYTGKKHIIKLYCLILERKQVPALRPWRLIDD